MSSDLVVCRAELPTGDYEWAVVPEEEPLGWEFDQVVRELPERHKPWTPIPAVVTGPVEGRRAQRATMPWWSGARNVLVLRDEAIESVGSLLAPHGELLPMAGRNARLVMFTAPFVDDVLNEGKSDLHSPIGSDYARLERGVFRAELVGQRQAFVARIGRDCDLFLTESLARQLEATGDTAGVVFEQIGVAVRES